jgi:hypothetical protein
MTQARAGRVNKRVQRNSKKVYQTALCFLPWNQLLQNIGDSTATQPTRRMAQLAFGLRSL